MEDFRVRVLDAVYRRNGVDGVHVPSEGAPQPVRLLFAPETGEDAAGLPGGFLSSLVQDGVIIRLRAHDPGLAGAAPVHGGALIVAPDAPIRAGEVFEILGQPTRMDSGRLEWTCQCSAPDPVIEEPGEA